MWLHGYVADGEFTPEEADKLCAEFRGLGFDDWRNPTMREQQLCIDYGRYSSAADADLYGIKSGWHCTSTEVHKDAGCSPGSRRFAYFYYGSGFIIDRNGRGRVRAVRSL